MMPHEKWPDRVFWIGLAVLCAFVYGVHFVFILNHFYVTGAFLKDSGWLADLIYRSDWVLTNPKATDIFHPKSFFLSHTSLIFLPFSGLSWLLPVGRVEWYANFQGLVYASCTLGVGVCARGLLTTAKAKLTAYKEVAIVLGLALIFSSNGIIWASIGVPHFEMLICGLALLFMHNLLRYMEQKSTGSCMWMWVLWVLLISVREDAGFHLAAILLIVCTYYLFAGIPFCQWKTPLFWALLSVLASVFLIVWQKLYFPGDDALGRVYLGDPPMEHLQPSLLMERFKYFLTHRIYIWLPWVVVCLIAAVRRNLMLTVGLLAYVPWFWLNFLAASLIPSSLQGYYAYPLFLSQVWVLLSPRFESLNSTVNTTTARKWHLLVPLLKNRLGVVVAISGAALVGISSFAGYWKSENKLLHYHSAFLFDIPDIDYGTFTALNTLIESSELPINEGLVDWGIASLFPDYFGSENILENESCAGKSWVLFYTVGNMAATHRNTLWKCGFSNFQQLGDTNVGLAVKPSIELPEKWHQIARPPTGLLQLSLTTGEEVKRALSDPRVESNVSSKDWQFFGPHWKLEVGTYRFEAEIEWEALTETEGYVLYYDVVGPSRLDPLYKIFITEGTGHPRKGSETIVHEFTLTEPVANFEFRHHTTGAVKTWLNRAELVRVR